MDLDLYATLFANSRSTRWSFTFVLYERARRRRGVGYDEEMRIHADVPTGGRAASERPVPRHLWAALDRRDARAAGGWSERFDSTGRSTTRTDASTAIAGAPRAPSTRPRSVAHVRRMTMHIEGQARFGGHRGPHEERRRAREAAVFRWEDSARPRAGWPRQGLSVENLRRRTPSPARPPRPPGLPGPPKGPRLEHRSPDRPAQAPARHKPGPKAESPAPSRKLRERSGSTVCGDRRHNRARPVFNAGRGALRVLHFHAARRALGGGCGSVEGGSGSRTLGARSRLLVASRPTREDSLTRRFAGRRRSFTPWRNRIGPRSPWRLAPKGPGRRAGRPSRAVRAVDPRDRSTRRSGLPQEADVRDPDSCGSGGGHRARTWAP